MFSDSPDTLFKEDILLNHKFNVPYEPKIKIVSIQEPNESTVELEVLETNRLLELFEIDTIGYLYRYTISNSRITRIEVDTIPNSGFNYLRTDSLYQARLAELFDWISFNYPNEYQKIENMDEQSAQIILEMARKKEGNNL